jgi:hypothetical protein
MANTREQEKQEKIGEIAMHTFRTVTKHEECPCVCGEIVGTDKRVWQNWRHHEGKKVRVAKPTKQGEDSQQQEILCCPEI